MDLLSGGKNVAPPFRGWRSAVLCELVRSTRFVQLFLGTTQPFFLRQKHKHYRKQRRGVMRTTFITTPPQESSSLWEKGLTQHPWDENNQAGGRTSKGVDPCARRGEMFPNQPVVG